MKHTSLAIPIRKVDFSDTSQIVSFLTPEFGVVEAIAKGAYREKNAFQGPFDLVTRCQLVFVARSGGEALAIVAEATQLDGFRGVRQSWERWAAAAFILEFLRVVAVPGEPSHDLFAVADRGFTEVSGSSTGAELAAALGGFELRAYRALGLCAEIRSCSDCGRAWSREDRPVFFAPELGGLLCPACRDRQPARRGRLVPGAVVRRLNRLGEVPEGELEDGPRRLRGIPHGPHLEPDDAERDLRALVADLRLFLLERRLRMLEYAAPFV